MKISYIIPVHNSEKYILECINSIVNQEYKDIEIIIVENGSTDNTPAVCYRLAQQNTSVLYLNSEIVSPGAARNIGIKVATGDIICFIDSDDKISSNHGILINKYFQNDIDILIFSVNVFSDTHDIGCIKLPSKRMYCEEAIEFCFCEPGAYTTLWNKAFRVDIVKDIVFDESLLLSEDVLYLSQVLVACNRIESITDVLYYWRRHANSLSARIFARLDERGEGIVSAQKQILNLFQTHCQSVVWIAAKEYLNSVRNIALEAYSESNSLYLEKYRDLLGQILKNKELFNKSNIRSYFKGLITYVIVRFKLVPSGIIKIIINRHLDMKTQPRKRNNKNLG